METSKEKMKVIGTRCTIIAGSEEAKDNAEVQAIAADIVKTVNSTKELHFSIRLKNDELLSTKKETKKWAALAVNGAVNALLMLESLKPTAEANPKKLATKSNFMAMKRPAFLEQTKIIGNQLKEKSSELLARGYKQAQIDEVTTNAQKMQLSIDKETALGVELSLLRNKCKALEPTINSKFNTLNSIVTVNQALMPTLYKDYFAVKQSKTKTAHMTITGYVTCEGKPLPNASIKIFSTEEVKKKSVRRTAAASDTTTVEKVVAEKLSNVNGEFATDKLKAGKYRGRITKNGLTVADVTLFVNPKEVTRIDIALDKLESTNN
ncbi:carboxypeptidase-like regulatory domain-containing protein [uncultured Acetobacteroides sp.]|uniref:carboxypeptidase-like regulatory domain-containing protein n=1 Tax=uncultured Acetobacteroides sp. TaxID=1760811 RepID=UPI0029F52A4C|nr:carboxypeptidase-like regulatory domain-containing protein [uncultured Acetobacteroides sp.]